MYSGMVKSGFPRERRDLGLPLPHAGQGPPEPGEGFPFSFVLLLFLPQVHSSPRMLCLERNRIQLQNLLPVNFSIPEHFENRCNALNIVIKVK